MIIPFNYFEIELPIQALKDCFHQGACDQDVEYWSNKLGSLGVNKDKLVQELEREGCWTKSELELLSLKELEQKIIWIAAGNYADGMYNEEE